MCSPATMLAAAAVVHTTIAEPCLKPRVCSTKPLLVSPTEAARPIGTNSQPNDWAS